MAGLNPSQPLRGGSKNLPLLLSCLAAVCRAPPCERFGGRHWPRCHVPFGHQHCARTEAVRRAAWRQQHSRTASIPAHSARLYVCNRLALLAHDLQEVGQAFPEFTYHWTSEYAGTGTCRLHQSRAIQELHGGNVHATSVKSMQHLAREDGCSAGVAAASSVPLLCSDACSSPDSILGCLGAGDGDGDLPIDTPHISPTTIQALFPLPRNTATINVALHLAR